MKIIIVGAGIGGLSLALMLRQRGIECDIYESVRALKPLGVGINLLPHAVAELAQIGLLDGLRAGAVATSALHYYNLHGQPIWQEPRGLAAGYSVPQLSIHRGELQLHLAAAVRDRLGPDRLHTGMAFESLEQDGAGVTARFRNRADGSLSTVRADALVGADGIHSAVRLCLHPHAGAPRFSGRMLWRAITPALPYLDGRTMFMAGHQDQKFVAYPISAPDADGLVRINWIAELSVPDGKPPASDWNRQVDKAAFAAAFDTWRWDWIDIPALIDAAPTIYEFPLVDKDPLSCWTQGRATLLGDAAHPMYPIGSNGSAQAILDARCAADCLSAAMEGRTPSLELALREYEAERIPPTTGIVLRNRLNGPEQVMQLAHQRAPQGFAHVHDVISREELEATAMRYKRLAGFDPERLHAASATQTGATQP
ncbi:flavin-dependent oxidoreductase [Candidimonas humi]|uniref:Flavin-dependent oxidoreductase n=1 Tax=Candidimonas humi TaxID=683355 RepID=A0ABV8NQW5_9BURK|nr:flavin-dependent oxidoreductase [Candidimonas humi]